MRIQRGRWVSLIGVLLVGLARAGGGAVWAEDSVPAPAAAPSEAAAPATVPTPPAPSAAPAAPAAAPAAVVPTAPVPVPEYLLRLGDRLQMSVWGEPNLTTEAVVMPDGTVSLPMIGALPVVGKTIPAVTAQVAQAYEKYLKDPKVQLTCLAKSLSQVYVGGAVAKPGPLEYDPRWRLIDYLGMAGGPAVGADMTRVVVTSVEGTGTSSRSVDLSRTKPGEESAQNPALQPGDTVWVGRALPVAVVGAVAKPGSFDYQPGLRLSDYLGMAGGPTEQANLKQAALKHAGTEPARPVDLRQTLAKPDSQEANPTMQPGDVVTVAAQFVGGTLGWSDILRTLASALFFLGR